MISMQRATNPVARILIFSLSMIAFAIFLTLVQVYLFRFTSIDTPPNADIAAIESARVASNLLRTALLSINIAAVCLGVVVVAAFAPGLLRRLFFGRSLDLPPLSGAGAFATSPDAPTIPRRRTQYARCRRSSANKIFSQ